MGSRVQPRKGGGTEIITQTLRFIIDEEAVSRAAEGNNRIFRSLKEMEDEFKKAESALNSLRKQFGPSAEEQKIMAQFTEAETKELQELGDAIKLAKGEIKELNTEMESNEKIVIKTAKGTRTFNDELAKTRAQAIAIGHVGTGIGSVGRSLDAISGAGLGGFTGPAATSLRALRGITYIQAELPLLTEIFKKNQAQMIALGAAGIALAATLSFVQKAHENYAKKVEEAKTAIDKMSELQVSIAERLITATEDDVQKSLQAAQTKERIALDELKRLEDLKAASDASGQSLTEWVEGGRDLSSLSDKERSRLEELHRLYGKAGQSLEDWMKEVESQKSGVEPIKKLIGEILDYTGIQDFNKESEAYQNQIDEQVLVLADARVEVEQWTVALGSNVVALNTYFQRILDLQEATTDGISKEIEYQGQLTDAIDSMTPDQVTDKLESLQNEMELARLELSLYEQALADGTITQEVYDAKSKEINETINELTRSYGDFATVVMDAALAREAEAAAIEKFAELVKKELDLREKVNDALGEYALESYLIEREREKEILKAETDYALEAVKAKQANLLDLARLDQDYYLKRAKILEGAGKEDSEIAKKRLKIEEDFNEDMQKLNEDHLRKLYEIERDGRRSILESAANLDAVGVLRAIQARDDALDDEKYKYNQEKKEREKDRQDRLKEIEEEREKKKEQYEDQLEDLDEAHELERSRREEDYRIQQSEREAEYERAKTDREQAYQDEDDARVLHVARQLEITDGGFKDLEDITELGMDNFVATVKEKIDSLSFLKFPEFFGSGFKFPKLFGRGGFPAPGRDAILGDAGPELVRFFSPAQVIPMNVGGSRVNSKSLTVGDIYIQGGNTNEDTAQAVLDTLEALIG